MRSNPNQKKLGPMLAHGWAWAQKGQHLGFLMARCSPHKCSTLLPIMLKGWCLMIHMRHHRYQVKSCHQLGLRVRFEFNLPGVSEDRASVTSMCPSDRVGLGPYMRSSNMLGYAHSSPSNPLEIVLG